ncbi:MAG: hypothetical protein VW339_14365 [Quisquiliibacterium sp.]
MNDLAQDPHELMHSIIQRIATGPEFSKNISRQEAERGTGSILDGVADPVQAAVFLIALRMKRETLDEFLGVHDAILARTQRVTAAVDELVDIADPYDGYARCLPAAPLLPPLLAELGVPAVSHGVEAVGPKFGLTARHVLRAAGVNVDLAPQQAAARLSDPALGWSYVDQAQFCKPLHELISLRQRIIKRQVVTTIETEAKPIVGRKRTHFVTGYVHKPYPPIYAALARNAGFDSALIIRGVEGGITPSLRQPGRYTAYHDQGQESEFEVDPAALGITQSIRAVALPDGLAQTDSQGDEVAMALDIKATAQAAAQAGLSALSGTRGATYDSLALVAAIVLHHLGKARSLPEGADMARAALDSGKAVLRVK